MLAVERVPAVGGAPLFHPVFQSCCIEVTLLLAQLLMLWPGLLAKFDTDLVKSVLEPDEALQLCSNWVVAEDIPCAKFLMVIPALKLQVLRIALFMVCAIFSK